jgi:hypothetical protein
MDSKLSWVFSGKRHWILRKQTKAWNQLEVIQEKIKFIKYRTNWEMNENMKIKYSMKYKYATKLKENIKENTNLQK